MKFEGIITPMLTPFNNEQELDLEATKKLVNHLLDNGVSGLFILGTNGEFHVLTKEEKLLFAKTVIETTNHRVPVYVGTGENSTRETIELSLEMEALGADALSVITPYFLAPSKEELIQHYKSVAASVNLPIILYNIPKNTGINITPEIAAELADVKNIVALKDSSGDMEQMGAYIDACKGKNIQFLVGSDSKMLEAFKLGAVGAIAGTSNVITQLDVNIYKNFIAGNMEEAQHLQDDMELFRSVNKMGSVPSIMKKALEIMGISVGCARLPVSEPDENIINEIKKMLLYYHLS
ncbi:MAG: 4-hydroxy-tetrahydrodipicolinate synthase [Longicatena sp.]